MKTQIKETRGIRKDFGDLTSLIESIKKVGLIHPITISKDGVIVVGRRRHRAWQILHKRYPKQFEAFPPFITHPLTHKELTHQPNFNLFNMMQIHENTQRKEFTAEEISSIKDQFTKQREAGNLPEAAGRDTRDLVAEITGISPKQVDKIDVVVKAAKKTALGKKTLMKLNKGQISVDTAYQMVTRDERNLPKVIPPKGQYDKIYCDIPIKFDDEGVRGSAEHHYPTEPKEYFLNIEIPSAENCVIFFWIPAAFLIDGTAAQILNNWGFYPKALFTWDKEKIGNGYWSRNQTEYLIMGVKGTIPLPAKLFSTLIKSPRGVHSKKPNEFVLKMIDEMYPKRTGIILWHRGPKPEGWDVHGNEIEVHQSGLIATIPSVDGPQKISKTGTESPIEKLRKNKK